MIKITTAGGGEDITKLRIYSDDKQFRHQFKCPTCDKPNECICYDTLEDAITGVLNTTFYCDRCLLLLTWEDDDNCEHIDEICGTHMVDKVKLIDKYENGEVHGTPDYRAQRAGEIRKECEETLKNLTDEQVRDVICEYDFDCDMTGSSCEV